MRCGARLCACERWLRTRLFHSVPPIVRKPPECRGRGGVAHRRECLSLREPFEMLQRVQLATADTAAAPQDYAESNLSLPAARDGSIVSRAVARAHQSHSRHPALRTQK